MALCRRKTWLRIVIAAGLGLAAAYGVYLIIWLTSSREEIAEADRLDPGWQLEELEQKREVIADEENGALVVLMASKLWPQKSSDADAFWSQGGTEESIIELPPEIQLNSEQQAALKKELKKTDPALEEARKLLHLSRGRYPSTGSREDGSAAADCQESRRIANLLQLDSILQAQETHVDEALETALGVLNAGRSIGDDPYTISQLVRISCDALAVRTLERVLAQGEPSEKKLQIAQHLVEDEAAQPVLLMAVRGDRADTFEKMAIAKPNFVEPWLLRGLFQLQTKCVEAAKAPPQEQLARVEQLKAETSKRISLSSLWFSSFEKTAKVTVRNQALLRCGYVALAVERYRRARNRWPDSLATLVPEFLRELPVDPYNGLPLKYGRLDDGVVIYSVGPDGQDNGGNLDRQNPTASGTDIGFQLWDVPHRRQPWRPPRKQLQAQQKNRN